MSASPQAASKARSHAISASRDAISVVSLREGASALATGEARAVAGGCRPPPAAPSTPPAEAVTCAGPKWRVACGVVSGGHAAVTRRCGRGG